MSYKHKREAARSEMNKSDEIQPDPTSQIVSMIDNLDKDSRDNTISVSKRKKVNRRTAKELNKKFACLYNCGKSYATDAARNMHMREKHNDVTKTERDRKAREIIRLFRHMPPEQHKYIVGRLA